MLVFGESKRRRRGQKADPSPPPALNFDARIKCTNGDGGLVRGGVLSPLWTRPLQELPRMGYMVGSIHGLRSGELYLETGLHN